MITKRLCHDRHNRLFSYNIDCQNALRFKENIVEIETRGVMENAVFAWRSRRLYVIPVRKWRIQSCFICQIVDKVLDLPGEFYLMSFDSAGIERHFSWRGHERMHDHSFHHHFVSISMKADSDNVITSVFV